MLIRFTPAGDAPSLRRLVDEVAADPAVGLVLVLSCDGNGLEPTDLDPGLQAIDKPVIGGIFPYVLRDARTCAVGSIVVGLVCAARVEILAAGEDECALATRLATAAAQAPDGAILVFADSQCEPIQRLVDALVAACGDRADCLGAAAGSLALVRRPCVLSNRGLLEDAAVVAFTDIHAGIGVAHGWQAISPGFEVTATAGKAIVALDGRPAFEAYREVVERHSGRSPLHTAFSTFAMAYPLGIALPDGGLLVRDPVVEDGGRLLCLGHAATGSRIHVLHGTPATLAAAASRARRIALASCPGGTAPQAMLLLGCVSRALLLQDDFERELALAHAQARIPLFGALTLGEIAGDARGRPAHHNRSLVHAVLGA